MWIEPPQSMPPWAMAAYGLSFVLIGIGLMCRTERRKRWQLGKWRVRRQRNAVAVQWSLPADSGAFLSVKLYSRTMAGRRMARRECKRFNRMDRLPWEFPPRGTSCPLMIEK